ncbi:protein adenylyltransferase SelO [Rhizobium alvei]|uniref:Protein nucleotidyltransferase YdiU n=1 Tax=Rhizobium alvei TaxID=1132659 RepID=A0ABT8YI21_9HYPH|nr:YdiU family protein [Rhizobium alvei]MDO6963303.1 YdiU family protein [Rhizobium alvei]
MNRSFIPFDNSFARLPSGFHLPQAPSPAESPKLFAFNHSLAAELGLDISGLNDETLATFFSGQAVPPGAEPLAMAYAGHQFGHFNPVLGDGRAILLGEVVDRNGRRRDIQLKGAGQTPFSRRGDGRAALGPVMREYIVSEAMYALGVPATRALAATTTGQPVYRERVLPGAVFTRVAASHIRVGTFQYFAARGQIDHLRMLADHVIDRHYPDARQEANPYLALLDSIIARQAHLIARWMGLGFIHGVMNTDNMAVSGETIDFGPCAFLDEYDPAKKFSSIDEHGRYAYRNQPAIGQWNLARLAETLLPLIDADNDRAVELASRSVVDFAHRYNESWLQVMAAKIGIGEPEEEDRPLIEALLAIMQAEAVDFTIAFRKLAQSAPEDDDAIADLFEDRRGIHEWLDRWRQRLRLAGIAAEQAEIRMKAANPFLIPRNHRIEEAIEAAIERDDFSLFHRLNQALSDPFDDTAANNVFATAPQPEQRVLRTFCGT